METKSDYEWGNLCANSINVSDCSDYLNSYKKIEFYKNYLDQINKNIQQLFNNYKNSIEYKSNNMNLNPIQSAITNPNNMSSLDTDGNSTLIEKNN
jgi:hypothetical protein